MMLFNNNEIYEVPSGNGGRWVLYAITRERENWNAHLNSRSVSI